MRYREIMECTTSANVASVSNSMNAKNAIGVGFDPDGDFGIYNFAKKKKNKKTEDKTEMPVIKRK